MKSLINTMGRFWLILLGFSLAAAGLIYLIWLQDKLL